VLTGSGEVVVAQQAYALGARSFLTKPLNSDELKHTMDMLGKFKSSKPSGDTSLGKTPINP
jgi:FixJ family two-component response regulator